jgi:hypothetical protein
MITTEKIRELFDYQDGNLIWKQSSRNGWVGKVAGNLQSNGYTVIKVDGKFQKAHRLVWLWHGKELPESLDHINRNRSDNRIENLRATEPYQNASNRTMQVNNTSKSRNVCWHKQLKKWVVSISSKGKRICLGAYEDFELADLVAVMARQKYHKEFANV